MKKLYLSTKHRKYNTKRSEYGKMKKKLHKLWLKSKRKSMLGKTREEIAFKNNTREYTVIKAPSKFSFLANTDEVIYFIKLIKKQLDAKNKVFINLKDVQEIDYGAITTLLSIMVEFKLNNIKINGNFPTDYSSKKLLIESDFFKYLAKPINEKIQYTFGKENQIFTRGNKKVVSELGLLIMQEVSKTIWGKPKTLKGLQRTLVELMQNTTNHAALESNQTERWWLSVSHNSTERKVSFVFVDYGVGIFKSLKNKPQSHKWYHIIKRLFKSSKPNFEILRELLNGDIHMTVTGEHFRGKGLPGIKEVHDRNQISNLFLITNDTYADIASGHYKKLHHEFNGTFLYWEINEQSEVLEWNQ